MLTLFRLVLFGILAHKTAISHTTYPGLCLWDTNCAADPSKCEPGTYCATFESPERSSLHRSLQEEEPHWSQCQENSSGEPSSDCYVTRNGPYHGQRWGCEVDADCCNEAATCVIESSDSKSFCLLQCALNPSPTPAPAPTVATPVVSAMPTWSSQAPSWSSEGKNTASPAPSWSSEGKNTGLHFRVSSLRLQIPFLNWPKGREVL